MGPDSSRALPSSGAPLDVGIANRQAMLRADTVALYEQADYLDAGEKLLYDAIAPEAKDKPILDIGVGGGRTVEALTAISRNYTAIDYSPEMVEVVKRRYPSVRVLHADARDMSMFPDGSIFLVVFSCAGIDMVDHADRLKILREVRRILAPGGAFVFSTHGLEFRMQEGDPTLWDVFLGIQPTRNPAKLVWRVARGLPMALSRVRNYRALRPLAQKHEDWAILNSRYHHYGTLMHYITLDAQRAELERAGFEPKAVGYSGEGQRLEGGAASAFMLHFLARAPAGA
jgi:SAM-dependent methyltransferase